jgi:nicotinamide-nucleotide amidase
MSVFMSQRDAHYHIYTPALEDAAAAVLQAAEKKHLRIAAAESCTGGALAALLTDVEGLSHVFDVGFAVYSEEAKQDCLGVPHDLIASHGAVSREVAHAMARGALNNSRADVAIAITGNAGPAGPDDETGLVHLCAAVRDGGERHGEHHFGALGRAEIRIRCIESALDLLTWAVRIAPPKDDRP